jgi:hypothetical protein
MRQKGRLETMTRNVGGNLPRLTQVKTENDAGNNGDNGNGDSESNSESEDEHVSRKGKGKGKGKGEGARKGRSGLLQEMLDGDERALKSLLKELLKEMNIGGVRKSRSRRKVCRATGLDEAKKEQQRKLSTEDDLNCKVSSFLLFQRPSPKSTSGVCPHNIP